MEARNLTENEKLFCELYATGEAPFAGDPSRCYEEAFGCVGKNSRNKALKILSNPEVQQYLKELEDVRQNEVKEMKNFLTQNLKHVISECSQAEYRDRRGHLLSPAASRSVAVSAAKALMEMYPVKETQVNKLSIEGAGESGITFNVIMPEKPSDNGQE